MSALPAVTRSLAEKADDGARHLDVRTHRPGIAPAVTELAGSARSSARSSTLETYRFRPGVRLLERYEVQGFLGRGGMGEVYKAEDHTLEKGVALKFLRPTLARNPAMVEQFRREVRIAQDIAHPYICRVHDIGEVGGGPFFSMELALGGSLFDLLRYESRLPGFKALKIAWQLSSALEALHQKNLVHRDLKPANVLFDGAGDLRISDLGLAVPMAELSTGTFLQGTIPYMSPEQLAGKPLTKQSDLYSLGLILYEVFTGYRAFRGTSHAEIRAQQLTGLPPPSSLYQDLDPQIERLIVQCLAREPAARPSSAREVYQDIGLISSDVERMDVAVIAGETPPRGHHVHAVVQTPGQPRSFVSGRAVGGELFLNRHAELGTIFSRIDQGESTAIVGPRKSGKSSLLQKLNELETQQLYRPDMLGRLTFVWMDLHTVASDFDPAEFWQECVAPLSGRTGDPEVEEKLVRLAETSYRPHGLRDLFEHLGRRRHRLVLLLDEFEQLVSHPGFRSGSRFFALLRSVATNTGSLSLVVASRYSVAELNRSGPAAEDGSPYFNYLIDVHLLPFDDRTIDELMGWAGDALSTTDRRFIRCLAGRHPYLLQAAASSTLLAPADDSRREVAAETFYNRFFNHFDQLWKSQENRYRTVLLLLGLAEWAGRAERRSLDYQEIARGDEIGYELSRLAMLGLAEEGEPVRTPHGCSVTWRGERWTVGVESLLWWIWELVFSRGQEVEVYREWLAQEEYAPFVDRREWEKLLARARGSSRAFNVPALARELVRELDGPEQAGIEQAGIEQERGGDA